MIIDNIKALLLSIIFVLLLLSVCAGVDYADEITINQTIENNTNCTLVKGIHYDNNIANNTTVGVAKLHKIVTEKPKLPLIKITAKPSCGCRNSY